MSCESCIATRQAANAAYIKAREAALVFANQEQKPVFIYQENDAYHYYTEQYPNAIEAVLPDR